MLNIEEYYMSFSDNDTLGDTDKNVALNTRICKLTYEV